MSFIKFGFKLFKVLNISSARVRSLFISVVKLSTFFQLELIFPA